MRIADTDNVAKLLEERESQIWSCTRADHAPPSPLCAVISRHLSLFTATSPTSPNFAGALVLACICRCTTEDLKASSAAQQPVKKDKDDGPKKKKRGRRALKITNTHMKALVGTAVCIHRHLPDHAGHRLYQGLRGTMICGVQSMCASYMAATTTIGIQWHDQRYSCHCLSRWFGFCNAVRGVSFVVAVLRIIISQLPASLCPFVPIHIRLYQ